MAFSHAPRDPISPAEGRVLAEVRHGLSNKAIATALVLSPRTIESHVSSLLAKTGCRSRTELVLWAMETEERPGDMLPASHLNAGLAQR